MHLSERHRIVRERRQQKLRSQVAALQRRSLQRGVRNIASREDVVKQQRAAALRVKVHLERCATQVRNEAKAADDRNARLKEIDTDRARIQSLDRVRRARAKRDVEPAISMQQQVAQEQAALRAARAAEARVRERDAAALQKKERDVTRLVSTQLVSSIEALNVERLIAPRMEERFVFRGQLTPREEQRLAELMRSDRIGHFDR